ncbi:MAG: ferritin family protein [Proteobacteria bacterium]|nr:ferritin family protein [Pseudomonadota bacterium]
MQDQKLSEIIDIAILREQEAYEFYMDLYKKIEDQAAQETLEWVAAEEKKHKAFLVDYRDGNYGAEAMRMSEVAYYKIAEHQQEPEIAEDMRREDVFLLAAHRELKSYNFYTEVAGLHPDGETKTMLLKIANEELKHKEKMEYLYANTAFPQTDGG